MRVKKEAGVLLISGLPKLTPLPCLLSLQTSQLIAITCEMRRGALLVLQVPGIVRREPRAGLGARNLGGKQGFTLQRHPMDYFTRMGRKLEQKNREPDPGGGEITDSCAMVFFQPRVEPKPL